MENLDSMAMAQRRKRIVFRSWHRGTRETDLILGRFADAAINEFSELELAEFERILDMPDPDIFAWVTGIEPVPSHADTALFTRLIAFHDKNSALPDA